MICVNELTELKCNKREMLEKLAIIISPYAPHIAEEFWSLLGHTSTIVYAPFPVFEEKYLVENSIDYPVSFNGKMRYKVSIAATANAQEVEQIALSSPEAEKWLEGKTPKKVIVVVGKIVNVVI